MRNTSNTKYSIIDVETTGLGFEAEIIEFACLQTDAELRPTAEPFTTLVQPMHEDIPPMITEINGITEDMVKGAPTWYDLWPFVSVLLSDTVLVGHNIEFDIRMMAQATVNVVNSRRRNFYPGRPINTQPIVGGQRLQNYMKEMQPELAESAHTALGDCNAVYRLCALDYRAEFDMHVDRARRCSLHFPVLLRANAVPDLL